ncbi:cryptochrome/photolyase family protein [Albirhodobacter sp. R86504]|uniref:cryptochrome/photolyase family protein n=1 Tax=Albirhodobacter sp. R86504 TaxID=3093848 RepID=UPI00366B509C
MTTSERAPKTQDENGSGKAAGAAPVLVWFRRDFRLFDHPALHAAMATGRPVIGVFLYDETVEDLGAAARWRMGLGLAEFARSVASIGGRVILRRGAARDEIARLVDETGASAVYWTRLYDPASVARDTAIKSMLIEREIEAKSFNGHVIFEPWDVETGQGGPYRVYSPFWKSVRGRDVAPCLAAPATWPAPDQWPSSDDLDDWRMGQAMRRGASVVANFTRVGEPAARARLGDFLASQAESYKTDRDFPDKIATSGLSENLTYGEISAREIWHAGWAAMERAGFAGEGSEGVEHFVKELVWREFAWHLLYHYPELATKCWKPDWENFAWLQENKAAEAWRRGRTGEPFVDAAMREMFVTGTMHNRARMICASYLTKHLLTDWRIGRAWFDDCLTDWDAASNAMGWQWVAGCGPDASPYFRVFNPSGQAEKFDKSGAYRDRFIAEGRSRPHEDALAYFEAIPVSWGMSPKDRYPAPIIALDHGRQRALEALKGMKKAE